jgi:hypothetical protein
MNPHPTSPRAGVATWFYRQLLRFYPLAFRRRYEEEMIQVFTGEWQRASAGGVAAQMRCGLHLMWDLIRAASREWSAGIPRVAVMALIAAGLGARYIAVGPMPLLLKVLGCAGLTTAFAVAVVAVAGRTRAAQLKLAILGLPIGLALALFLGLTPKPITPPESPVVAVADPTLTGREIYQRMRLVYANARTYADEGEEQTVFSGLSGKAHTRPFSTAFVRGGGFRFEFRDQYDRLDAWKEYVIWKDGASVSRWWTIEPRVEAKKDLADALSAAAGVSGTTSTIVPRFLHPEIPMGFLSEDRSPIELLGTQRVDGRETYRLQVNPSHGPRVTMWIDARSYLIDRISFSNSLPGWVRADQIIVYRPLLNGPISPAALTFQPGPALPQWRMLVGGQIYAMIAAIALTIGVKLLNLTHRRILRKGRKGKEWWLAPVTRRMSAGYIAIITVGLGIWLGGTDLNSVMQNLLFSQFMLQGGFLLYVIHRRSRGHARFAAAA